ncbi:MULTISPECIES: cytochrome C oxidase subunit IV family protein [unclassified Shewanella]|jgi:cytochrome c oxidase subunit IV|uniref:cytochrome C oxidase subunit IV family protein n=1 Tax=unclassified Shewanella TaxID=196818 RepID=UPI000C7E6D58|nr:MULTISPECIES: cytochrome C oxidase subunit IV family protein [unclassified Shewanella]PKG56466.1 hypothetical protein CXF82_14585 [Shewanella sp. GutDb-MelDb]PKG76645.1 hypothetical protein CXF86_00775 [Shewanella sp. GutCb]
MTHHQGLILRVYLYLIILTSASAYMGSVALDSSHSWLQGMEEVILASIMLFTLIKGLLIVDVYMELKQAPPLWRNLLRAYVILLPITIGLIYLLF